MTKHLFKIGALGLAGAMLVGAPLQAAPAQDLTIGLPASSVANLDPLGANALIQGNMQINAQIFDTLVAYKNGDFAPSLAKSWKASEDAKTWTFTLRDGAKFTDGSTVDAEDVKASVARVVELAGPLAGLFKPLTVTVTSPTELTFTSDVGQGALLGKLSVLAIIPSELTKDGEFGLHPVGSGPFKVDSFDPSQGVKLSANANYWGGAPALSSVSFRMIPEQAARSTALETGEIQLMWTVPDDEVSALQSNPDIKVESVPTLANIVLWFNSGRPTFKDVAVRKALWSAVDVPSIVSALYSNTGEVMDGPLPDAVFGSSQQTPYKYDPDGAKAALTAAGFDFSQTIKVLMNNNTYSPLVEAIIADWARIGVKGEIDLQEPAVGTKRLLALDWDIAIIQPVVTSTGDADYTLGRLYTCAANRTAYCDPSLDKLLNQAGAEPDQAKRADLYKQAGKIVWDQAVGMYPMNVKQVWAWSSKLDGVALDPVYKPDLTKVHFVQ
ncbi:MAG TPA: ABC transporter substrate-binding protein [Devosiaceae bacterium]|jgi:peptide/nickel transport system substrate-binding protein